VPNLAEIEARLDDVMQPLLVPLRVSKTLDPAAMEDLLGIGRDLAEVAPTVAAIPRSLVGKSWFVFTSMLAEADHTTAPEPILNAWQWAELLQIAQGRVGQVPGTPWYCIRASR
jgi:hypothetical protein